MKLWIKTRFIGNGTFENPKKPDLARLEDRSHYSALALNENECLVRVSCKPEDAELLKNLTILNDDDALEIIKSVNPNAELEDLDVRDIEVDEIAKQLGIDPKARADVQVPKGKKVLQDQENHLMALICEKVGMMKQDWDAEAQNSGRWSRGRDIEIDLKRGWADAHEFVLSKIRSKLNNCKEPEGR